MQRKPDQQCDMGLTPSNCNVFTRFFGGFHWWYPTDRIEIAGQIASIIGLIFVLIYMILSYGIFGVMANIALFFNIALILALLSALQATLTLPGIINCVVIP